KQPYEILGSGVIIDKRGYIITNNHVLGESKDSHIFITLSDGRQFQAELVGRSTHYDVALLRFSEKVPDMPVATLGDSDDLVPGEWAIAIGSPYRYLLDDPALTVTVGVISALHRDLKQAQDEGPAYLDMIQTDAAINQGNSGGALVNAKGEVIGINTFIISGSDGGNFGAGFALPIKRVKWVMDEIVQYGGLRPRVTGFLGAVLDKRWRYLLKLDDDMTGIYVGRVYPDSPASEAGLKVGDVIRAINGQVILRKQDFTRLIYEAQVGTKLHLKVQHGDEMWDTVLTISSHPPATPSGEK
ncbi:MAG TPA: trypsin-like peptidase domain-containing protein, partial [Candidatus Krumholzibacteria bacterium]|nr:trypsin-like peptidase domain-containing protein [Candidatus Krumholzibacteria bacterium]